MSQLFRAMKETSNGLPVIEQSSRGLGARPGIDVPATFEQDLVFPGDGGISVAPHDPLNLPLYRRPASFQGTGKDPVWMIDEDELGMDLSFRSDPDNPGHGYVEPVRPMTFEDYQKALEEIQPLWRIITGMN